jgi:DNA-binding SARP family transcriptional activator
MSTLSIRLFGQFSVFRDQREVVDLDAVKARELLGYLLLHPNQSCSRDSLTSLLWSDLPSGQGKKRLSQALWQLQSLLSSSADHRLAVQTLRVEPEFIQFNSQADIWCDVSFFEQVFQRVQDVPGQQLDAEGARLLCEAIQLYRGNLLDGWFQDWCIYERERLQDMYLTMLDKAVVYSEAQQLFETAVAYGMSILRYDRANERTHRRLMRLYYVLGDRTAALRQYERCLSALKTELGVRPSRRTVRLYEQICADELDHPSANGANLRSTSSESRALLSEALTRLHALDSVLEAFQDQIRREIDRVVSAIQGQS